MIPYDQIRLHYEWLTPQIIERSERHPRTWISPYCDIDWMTIFSPIEDMTWQAIRCFGAAPFYPQYPVDRFFVDFGNPALKIAIECDGHDYHLDKEKDNKRDERLFELGWKVYRIPGKDCVRPVNQEYYDLDYLPIECWKGVLSEFYYNTIEGLIKALAVEYFGYTVYMQSEECDEKWIVEDCLYNRRSSRQIYLEAERHKKNGYGLRTLKF